MKLLARSVAWLLPFCLTACFQLPFHKAKPVAPQAVAPPIADAKAPKPTPTHVDLPQSVSTIPTEVTELDTSPQAHSPEPKPPARRRKPQPPPTPAPPPVEQASNGNPGVSAIGQLSSGDPSDLRRETESSLAAIERTLGGINRKFSDQEQKTIAQIREFLKQARAALTSGDVDGAHTLAAKAKVLLNELSQ